MSSLAKGPEPGGSKQDDEYAALVVATSTGGTSTSPQPLPPKTKVKFCVDGEFVPLKMYSAPHRLAAIDVDQLSRAARREARKANKAMWESMPGFKWPKADPFLTLSETVNFLGTMHADMRHSFSKENPARAAALLAEIFGYMYADRELLKGLGMRQFLSHVRDVYFSFSYAKWIATRKRGPESAVAAGFLQLDMDNLMHILRLCADSRAEYLLEHRAGATAGQRDPGFLLTQYSHDPAAQEYLISFTSRLQLRKAEIDAAREKAKTALVLDALRRPIEDPAEARIFERMKSAIRAGLSTPSLSSDDYYLAAEPDQTGTEEIDNSNNVTLTKDEKRQERLQDSIQALHKAIDEWNKFHYLLIVKARVEQWKGGDASWFTGVAVKNFHRHCIVQ